MVNGYWNSGVGTVITDIRKIMTWNLEKKSKLFEIVLKALGLNSNQASNSCYYML